MQIDIEKLNRKLPYPEPSEAFFKTIQDNVISKTIGEKNLITQKEAKIFSLNFKWAAAAAVVLIAGITAFFGINESQETKNITFQKPIIDTVYNINEPVLASSSDHIASNNIEKEIHTDVKNTELVQKHSAISKTTKGNKTDYPYYNVDRQDYAVEPKKESEVEKVLAAFTPDQLKDLDKNSEQDVYLDLYN